MNGATTAGILGLGNAKRRGLAEPLSLRLGPNSTCVDARESQPGLAPVLAKFRSPSFRIALPSVGSGAHNTSEQGAGSDWYRADL